MRSCQNVVVSDGQVRYARSGDVHLAYRVFGDSGPVTVLTRGWLVESIDTFDDQSSPYAHLVDAFAQVMRLVVWDRRGMGLSDPATRVLSLDERMDDLRAVIDAVGTDRPAIFGGSEAGPICILFAATYPERVRALLLYGTAARFSQKLPDFPWGFTPAQVQARIDEIDQHWGEGALADLFHGAAADVPGVREMFGRRQRSMASPTMAKLWWQSFMDIDVRAALPSVRAPTGISVRRDDPLVSIEAAAALAAGIPDAQLQLLPPGPHNAYDIMDDFIEQTMQFLGARPSGMAEEQTMQFLGARPSGMAEDRVLKTVLFTDIVSSTERLSAQGDEHWRHQLDTHDRLVDHMLLRYGGVRASHTGDGIFALFEGPTKAARCALDLVPALAAHDIPIRAGIHTGECERRGDEWSGLTVHTGARIGAMAGPGEVLTSRTVRDLSAGSGLRFESLGAHRLKGLPEDTEVFRVTHQ
jgi:class 3 adenylate cyclase/pimeloyl-ACP methyl ester carboxylesterase